MTKASREKVNRYKRATATELRDVYRSWSYEKERAYKNCLKMKVDMNGYDFRITGHNCDYFSCGFLYLDGDGVEHLMYITKGANTDIVLEED